MTDALLALDRALLQWLTPWHTPWFDTVMGWISLVGTGGLIFVPLALAGLALPRQRAAAWRLILTLIVVQVVTNDLIKPLVGRPRLERDEPTAARSIPPMPRSLSFPSGHTASSVGAAVALSRMWPRVGGVWWVAAGLIAYSRLYLHHHYPSDVVIGALLGAALALWVLGGRHPATYASTLPQPIPAGLVIRP
jgi:undecaprenyl-diphosphatase